MQRSKVGFVRVGLVFFAVSFDNKRAFLTFIIIMDFAFVLIFFKGEICARVDIVLKLSDFLDMERIEIEGVLLILKVLEYDVTYLLEKLRREFLNSLAQLALFFDGDCRVEVVHSQRRLLLYLRECRWLAGKAYSRSRVVRRFVFLYFGQGFEILFDTDRVLVLVGFSGVRLINLKAQFVNIHNQFLHFVAIFLGVHFPFDLSKTQRILFRLYFL